MGAYSTDNSMVTEKRKVGNYLSMPHLRQKLPVTSIDNRVTCYYNVCNKLLCFGKNGN